MWYKDQCTGNVIFLQHLGYLKMLANFCEHPKFTLKKEREKNGSSSAVLRQDETTTMCVCSV